MANPELQPLRVLAATDGSPDAREAVRWLALFPLPPESTIRILSVVTIPPSPITFPGLEELRQSLLADGRHACEDAADSLRSRWPALELRVVDGDPREQLLRAAETWKPDLAVLGRRGLGGLERVLLGSVSLMATRHLPCSVLIPRGTPRPIRRVVVGVDGSAASRRAVDFLATLAVESDTEIHVVGVAPSLLVPASLPLAARTTFRSLATAVDEEQQARLRDVLAGTAGAMSTRVHVHTHVLLGDPARHLLEQAAGADLLVVGSRGLGAVRRLLLGTVSERVLEHAPCPVLIVKEAGPAVGRTVQTV